MAKLSYFEQLRHPNWQRRRLEVMESAGFACSDCGDKETTLNVHHKRYVKGRMAWEYTDEELVCLCEPCHQSITETDKSFVEMLLPVPKEWAFVLCGGYFGLSEVDPFIAEQARQTSPMDFRIGRVGMLCRFLNYDQLKEVAAFVRDMSHPDSEARPIYDKYFED